MARMYETCTIGMAPRTYLSDSFVPYSCFFSARQTVPVILEERTESVVELDGLTSCSAHEGAASDEIYNFLGFTS